MPGSRRKPRFILYRIFDSDGALLYVGATTNPALRFDSHHQLQPWWDEAAEIKLRRFKTWDALAAAEMRAIASEEPRYNIVHTGQPTAWPRRPQRTAGSGSVFQRASDGLWFACIEAPAGDGRRRQRRKGAKTREDAERKLALLREEFGL